MGKPQLWGFLYRNLTDKNAILMIVENQNEESMVYKSLTVIGLFALTIAAAKPRSAKEADPKPVDSPPTLTYQDVAPIFAANCQVCHSNAADMGLGGISVDTEEEVLEHPDLILKALETGWMPYENPEWHNTEDGQKLIAWLKTVVTVEPVPAPF